MNKSADLAMDLIQCPSVSPRDAGCMEIVQDRLAAYNFRVESLDFEDTKNIWLRHGEQGPLFAFLGHTDVVPPGPLEEWHSNPFSPEIRENYLYGRGAADMKSSIAAMVIACQEFLERNPRHDGSIALLLTSDEEALATNGIVKAIKALESRGEKIDFCLVGEPTSENTLGDTVKVGRRGSLCGTLRIFGTQGHVAYPQFAKNPIHQSLPALAALTQEVWDHGNDFFPPTGFQISNINAGTGAENVIPGAVDLLFNLRFSTELDESTIKKRVHEILDRYDLNYELNWRLSGNPFFTEPKELNDAVVKAIRSVTDISPKLSTSGGTSDGRFIAPTGAQVVEFGPSNASIHKVNECIKLGDIDKLTLIYTGILNNLFV